MATTISREERLSVIENLLLQRDDGIRAVELANACDVDRRTIYRDIARLQANGIPIYHNRGRFHISREYYLASVQLSLNETIALYSALRIMSQIVSQQNPHGVSALNKLSSALPETLSEHINVVARVMREAPIDRLYVTVLETLTRAWVERRQVHVWHKKEKTPLTLAPYFLEATAAGTIYVIGMSITQGQLRAIHLGQILRAELTTITYPQNPLFDPKHFLADATHRVNDPLTKSVNVVLALPPGEARLILNKGVHNIVKHEEHADGRIYLHIKTHDWRDLLPWVRTLGHQVEVIEPLSLRSTIIAELTQTLAHYKDG